MMTNGHAFRGHLLPRLFLGLLAAALVTPQLHAQVDGCVPQITFDEITPFTSNPVYNVGGTTVSFGSIFVGQVIGSAPNELVDSSPNNPLALDSSGPNVANVFDLATGGVVLGGYSGTTAFTTPIAIQFSTPMAQVCFDLGHLDPNGTTTIETYRADGTLIDSLTSGDQGGIEQISLTGGGISGISIFVQPGDMDWEGFAIDNLGFDPVPEPATVVIWCLLGIVAAPWVAGGSRVRGVAATLTRLVLGR